MTRPSEIALYRRLGPYLRPASRRLGLTALLILGSVGAELVQPLLLQQAIDGHLAPGRLDGLGPLLLGFLAAVALSFAGSSVATGELMGIGLQVLAALRRDVFSHVLQQGQRFFDRRASGSLLTRTTTDVEAVYEALAMGAVSLVGDALSILGILAAMLWLDPWLTLWSFALAPVIVLVVEVFRRKLRDLSIQIRKTLSVLNGFFAEHVFGMPQVQLYGAEARAREEFRELGYAYLDAYRRSNWWDAGLFAVMDGIGALSIGLMLWFGAASYGEASGVTLGLLVAFIDYLRRVFVPIRNFSGRFASLQRAVAALERVFGLLDLDERVPDGPLPLRASRGEVRFEAVRFGYAPNRPQVLDGVSFALAPGEVVALSGATGSGKTTIGRLLCRVVAGYQGRITVDGHEITQLRAEDVRAQVTVVHQDVVLFQGTLADNLAMGREVSRATLVATARRARVHDFIAALPQGYDTLVTEAGGPGFSVGQKQLFAIARAMVRDTPVVVLDEATASVDALTERLIDEAVAELFATRTVLVIAHRLSTIRKADRILVLHHGRVVQEGTHEALVTQEGPYKLLAEAGFAV
jgi:ATP-binding cassette subfamily B protein